MRNTAVSISIKEFVVELSEIFNTKAIRYIGTDDLKFTKVAFVAGAPGATPQIELMENTDMEVLVIGETNEWETVEYARDAVQQGRKKAFLILGHVNSEEAGMKWCANWLKKFIKQIPIK